MKGGITFPLIKQSIRSVFLDYTFPIMVSAMIGLNIFVMLDGDLFQDSFDAFMPFNASIFKGILLMVYAGYLGSKFFVEEFEKNIISSVLITPNKRGHIFIGKISSGALILLLLGAISFFQLYFSFSYWGSISILFLTYMVSYSLLILLSSYFIFMISTFFSFLFKNVLMTILTTTIWSVVSFFTLAFIPEDPELGGNMYGLLIALPFSSLQYTHEFISKYGDPSKLIFLVPAMTIIWLVIISYVVFRRVRT